MNRRVSAGCAVVIAGLLAAAPAVAGPPQADSRVPSAGRKETATQNQELADSVGFGGRLGRIFGKALLGSLKEYRPKEDTLILLPTAAAAVALDQTGVDRRFSDWLQPWGSRSSTVTNVYGSWKVQYPLTFGSMAIGELVDSERLADFGEEALVAIIEVELLFTATKVIAGRTRPDGANDRAMPSGHTGKTVAVAIVAWDHFGWKAGLPAAVLAAGTGFGRIDTGKHWLSDVMVGAAGAFVITGMVDRFYDGLGDGAAARVYAEKEDITLADRPRVDPQEWVIGERVVVGVRFVW